MNELLFCICLCPGVFIFLIDKIPLFKKLDSYTVYFFILLVISIFDIVILKSNLYRIFIVITISIILFIVFLFLDKNDKTFCSKLKLNFRYLYKPFLIIVLFPVCEEIIFRFSLFSFGTLIGLEKIHCFIISIVFFIVHHIYKEKLNCLKLLPFSIVISFIYFYIENILLCVLLHMLYNLLIYIYNINKYKRNSFF